MSRPATAAVRLLSGEREPCRVATTTNIALRSLQRIDDIEVAVNDRVLVKDQDDDRFNGIYTASEGDWFRASDARDPRSITEGVTVQVQDGLTHAGTAWRFANPLPNVGASSILITFYLSATFPEDAAGIIALGKADLIATIAEEKSDALADISAAVGDISAVVVSATAGLNALVDEGELYRDQTYASEGRAQILVDAAQAAYVGFQPDTFYDLGNVTDTVLLFPSDLGLVADAGA